MVNQLFEMSPKFVLIDELEKMNNTDQTSLLRLMETGIIAETKINKTRLTSRLFATANSCQKIIEPHLSRFFVVETPEYTFDEFKEIAVAKLSKEKIDRYTAIFVAKKVWYELGSNDIRDVLKVGRLTENPADIESIVRIMKKPIGSNMKKSNSLIA
jgi:replication-associated recombination protein RarA